MDLIDTFDHWKANPIDRAMLIMVEEDQGMYKNRTIVKKKGPLHWLKLDNRPKTGLSDFGLCRNRVGRYPWKWTRKGKYESFNPTWHKIFFGGLDMDGGGGELKEPPWKTFFRYFSEFELHSWIPGLLHIMIRYWSNA